MTRWYQQRQALFGILFLLAMGIASIVSCSKGSSIVKSGALRQEVISQTPLPGDFLQKSGAEEQSVTPGTGWLADVDPHNNLVFAGYRPSPDTVQFCLVLLCEPSTDRLTLLPLEPGETPLTALANPSRRASLKQTVDNFSPDLSGTSEYLELSLQEVIAEKRLGPPVPEPGRVFSTAVNFLSHFELDLKVKKEGAREKLQQMRPRVFPKYPPVLPPGSSKETPCHNTQIVGPYDEFAYSDTLVIPGEGPEPVRRSTRLDYEAEIGLVIGRSLTWETVKDMSDAELRAAVAGYVLISDTKSRNPQVMGKILAQNKAYPEENTPYLSGEESFDRAVGFWDADTVQWWGYAASCSADISVGPFLVAGGKEDTVSARTMMTARSYGPEELRGQPLPQDRSADVLYARQATILTEDGTFSDRMIWTAPQILRSILDPDENALQGEHGPVTLEPGDIVCLGTPGGVVISAMKPWQLDVLTTLLFWFGPLDFYDKALEKAPELFLHQGDELLFWIEGLGFQHQRLLRKTDES